MSMHVNREQVRYGSLQYSKFELQKDTYTDTFNGSTF